MGFMQNQSLDISEIVTETSMEPSPIFLEEDNDIEELQTKRKKLFQEMKRKNYYISSRHRSASKNRITGCQCH